MDERDYIGDSHDDDLPTEDTAESDRTEPIADSDLDETMWAEDQVDQFNESSPRSNWYVDEILVAIVPGANEDIARVKANAAFKHRDGLPSPTFPHRPEDTYEPLETIGDRLPFDAGIPEGYNAFESLETVDGSHLEDIFDAEGEMFNLDVTVINQYGNKIEDVDEITSLIENSSNPMWAITVAGLEPTSS